MKLDKAKKDYEILKSSITHEESNDTMDTSPTFKVLEEGATTLSKEEAGRLAQRQLKFIQHLQAALIRIENKTYVSVVRPEAYLKGKIASCSTCYSQYGCQDEQK